MSQMRTNLEHLKNHVSYPTNKKDLMAACNNMMDVPQADRDWIAKTLPEGKYSNAEDVIRAVLARV